MNAANQIILTAVVSNVSTDFYVWSLIRTEWQSGKFEDFGLTNFC